MALFLIVFIIFLTSTKFNTLPFESSFSNLPLLQEVQVSLKLVIYVSLTNNPSLRVSPLIFLFRLVSNP